MIVIYYDGTGRERQCTVITAMYGPLAGRRIVRGREEECKQHYSRPVTTVSVSECANLEFNWLHNRNAFDSASAEFVAGELA